MPNSTMFSCPCTPGSGAAGYHLKPQWTGEELQRKEDIGEKKGKWIRKRIKEMINTENMSL